MGIRETRRKKSGGLLVTAGHGIASLFGIFALSGLGGGASGSGRLIGPLKGLAGGVTLKI